MVVIIIQILMFKITIYASLRIPTLIIFFNARALVFFLGQDPWGYLKSTLYMPGTKPSNLLGKSACMTQS